MPAQRTNKPIGIYWNLFVISNLDSAGRKASFLNKPAWASLAFLDSVKTKEIRILYNKSNSGCFRLKCFWVFLLLFFFSNERLLFVNETMYSEETENCLYSYLLENKRGSWWAGRWRVDKAEPISRVRSSRNKKGLPKPRFPETPESHIQCNSLLIVTRPLQFENFSFIEEEEESKKKRTGLKKKQQRSSDLLTCVSLTCK